MKQRVLIFIALFQYGFTMENSDNRVFIFAHEMDDVILPLPEHQQNLIEGVLWKKGEEHIASSIGNGILDPADPRYGEILSISHDGSLIIKAQSWGDGEQYTANITLNNNIRLFMEYHVRVHNIKFIEHDTGPKTVHATVGGTAILPLEVDVDESEIKEIDWLTDKWNYFAVTNTGGKIRVLEDDYAECLGSSSNGSLIFQRVSKRHEGDYRACVFLKNGKIMEKHYKILMDDHMYMPQALDRPSQNILEIAANHWEFTALFLTSLLTVIFIIVLIHLYIRKRKAYKGSTTKKQTYKGPTSEKQENLNKEKCKLQEDPCSI